MGSSPAQLSLRLMGALMRALRSGWRRSKENQGAFRWAILPRKFEMRPGWGAEPLCSIGFKESLVSRYEFRTKLGRA